ncbi:hypothetical protein N8J89_41405 [Crossiella sp. CA-258035]|uniref:hypothetical protein n=1 Tax=Crossiella sp. CA-258035 TaxID=2981138 RepID=UPI0024BC7ADB|nr:hypothetical protein [Crossiella sp. CA-258035]WHT19467.1 hypothetical protein N8J89_41405 [Crossiella sp. CA-258035]
MLDTVIGEVPLRDGKGDWRSRLARDDWALHTRHPWILHIAAGSALGILAGLDGA